MINIAMMEVISFAFFMQLVTNVMGSLNVFDEGFPIVGAPLGTAFPYDVDIARDPMDVPSEPLPDNAHITITSTEIEAFLAPTNNQHAWNGDSTDVKFRFFAFGGGHDASSPPKIPGPFIRTKEGRTLTVTLDNTGQETHSIDFHAVLGNKGGGSVLTATPGNTATLTFTLKNAGIYIYHCVGTGNVFRLAHHENNGMFGIILVEPAEGVTNEFTKLTEGAKEFYVVQQDIFMAPNLERGGINDFSEAKMLTPNACDYSVFNGRVGSLIDHPMIAEAGRNAVLYFGAVGDHISSPHIIGEIIDHCFIQGSILSPPLRNIQSTILPSSSAVVMVMDGDLLTPTDLSQGLGPQLNILVDHASSYMRKGAFGLMLVHVRCSDAVPPNCEKAVCTTQQLVNRQWTTGECIEHDGQCACDFTADAEDIEDKNEVVHDLIWEIQTRKYDTIDLHIGDTLKFIYGSAHNVWMLDDETALGLCDFSRGVQLASTTESPFLFEITRDGKYYFACQIDDHCVSGQTVVVDVGRCHDDKAWLSDFGYCASYMEGEQNAAYCDDVDPLTRRSAHEACPNACRDCA